MMLLNRMEFCFKDLKIKHILLFHRVFVTNFGFSGILKKIQDMFLEYIYIIFE